MIRTNVVHLTVIPASAYRRKLPAGGSGIVILRADAEQPGIASISKTSGKAIPADNTPTDLYPAEAFQEAISLTAGMPYKKQGSVHLKGQKALKETKDEAAALKEEEAVAESGAYQKIVDAFTDKNGKLSYDLLNKDLIKFAHTSSRVRAMIADRASEKAIRMYVAGTKFRNISGDQKLTDAQVQKIADLLDEVSPKGVFRTFNDEIRLKLKAAKKK